MNTKRINENIYEIIKPLKKTQSCYTYLAERDNKKYILRNIFHDEREYLTLEDKFNDIGKSFEKFEKSGLNVAKLVDIDLFSQCIVTEYIDGDSALDLIINKSLDEKYIYQMLDLQPKIIKNEFNINYFPENFIIANDTIYYIDLECKEYDKSFNFKNYGIYFWIYNRRLKKYNKTKDINKVVNNCMPIKTGLNFKRKRILNRYKTLSEAVVKEE